MNENNATETVAGVLCCFGVTFATPYSGVRGSRLKPLLVLHISYTKYRIRRYSPLSPSLPLLMSSVPPILAIHRDHSLLLDKNP